VPPFPQRFRSLNDFGENGMKWGTSDSAALARVETLTREELVNIGVTLGMANAWAEFYRKRSYPGYG
jgi:hypothetical protein